MCVLGFTYTAGKKDRKAGADKQTPSPSVPNLAADRHFCRLKSHGRSHEKTNCLSQIREGHYVLVKLNAPLSFVILNRLSLGHLAVMKMNSA